MKFKSISHKQGHDLTPPDLDVSDKWSMKSLKNEPGVRAVCKNVVSWPFMTVHGIHNAHFCV